jgi:PAS domain S-box-containing protein
MLKILRESLDDLMRKARAAPPESEALDVLRALVEQCAFCVIVANDAGAFVLTNGKASALTGYSRDELRSLSVCHVPIHLSDQETAQLWLAFLDQREQYGQYSLLAKDGHVVMTMYAARAHVLPGLHVSVVRPVFDQHAAF